MYMYPQYLLFRDISISFQAHLFGLFSSPVSLKMMSLSLKVGSGSIIARFDDLRKI